jgi:hypothetical protein
MNDDQNALSILRQAIIDCFPPGSSRDRWLGWINKIATENGISEPLRPSPPTALSVSADGPPPEEFAGYFTELTRLADLVVRSCDRVLSMRLADRDGHSVDITNIHATLRTIIAACAGIRRLVKQRGRNRRYDTKAVYRYRRRRTKALCDTLRGVSLNQIFLAAEARDPVEHFDERLDLMGASQQPPIPALEWLAGDLSMFQNLTHPSTRIYVTKTNEFAVAGKILSVLRLREEAGGVIKRVADRRRKMATKFTAQPRSDAPADQPSGAEGTIWERIYQIARRYASLRKKL